MNHFFLFQNIILKIVLCFNIFVKIDDNHEDTKLFIRKHGGKSRKPPGANERQNDPESSNGQLKISVIKCA